MATVSERSKELLEKQRLSVTHNLAWLEQALLAERRLAMEEAAKIAEDETIHYSGKGHITLPAATVRSNIGRALRAAAEKEVGTK